MMDMEDRLALTVGLMIAVCVAIVIVMGITVVIIAQPWSALVFLALAIIAHQIWRHTGRMSE